MSEKIGVKLALEGDREFRQQLSESRRELTLTGTELAKVTAQFAYNADGMAALTAKSEVYTKQLDLQRERVKTLESAVENWTKVQKSSADQIEELQKALRLAKDEMEGLERSSSGTAEEFEEQRKKIEGLEAELVSTQKAYDQAARKTQDWQTQLNRAEAELYKTENALSSTTDKMQALEGKTKTASERMKELGDKSREAGDKIKGIGDKISGFGNGMTKVISGFITAAATVSVAAMNNVDEGLDTIVTKTGATGESLDELFGIFENLAGKMPSGFGEIGAAIGEINTRLGFTGDQLERASEDFLKFATVNGLDVNTSIQAVTRAMGDAGIAAENYGILLDKLTLAGQVSGISVDTLSNSLTTQGAKIRALGIDLDDAIALFAAWEKAGVNTSIAFSGMSKAISNWGKEGKDAREEFASVLKEIEAAPNIADATAKSIEIFGAKAGPDLADAIQGGRFAFEDYAKALEKAGGTIESTYGNIVDEVDDTQIAIQNAQIALHDIGETIAKTAGPILKDLSEDVRKAGEWFSNLSEGEQKAIVKTAAFAAAAGPVISATGKIVTGIGSLTKGIGSATSGIGEFIGKLSTANTSIGSAAAGVTGFGSSIVSVLGPAGLVVVGIASLAALSNAIKEARKEAERKVYLGFVEGMSESMSEFENRVNSAKSVLDTLDIGAAFSPEKQQEITNGIEQAQGRIMEIAQLAASQSRALTNAEREEIESLISLIDSYVGEKLASTQATHDTIVELTKRGNITMEESLKSAKEMYDQGIQAAEESRNQKYQMAQEFDEKERQRLYDQADKEFEIEKAGLDKRYAEISAANLNNLQEQKKIGNQQLENLADLYDKLLTQTEEYNKAEALYLTDSAAAVEKYGENVSLAIDTMGGNIDKTKSEIAEALTGMDKDFAATFMNMATEIKENGGEITAEQQRLAQALVQAFETLPEDLRAEALEMMEAFGFGLNEKGEWVYTTAEGIVLKLGNIFNDPSIHDGTYSAGLNAGEGFNQGLASMEGEITHTAKRLAGTVEGVMGSVLEIRSPSRVMKRLGVYTAEGFEEGLREGIPKVEAMSDKLAEAALAQEETINRKLAAMIPWLNSPVPSLETRAALYGEGGPFYQGSPSSVAAGRQGSAPMANIVINLDGKTIGHVVTPVVSQEIQTQTVLAARGRGNPYI